MWAAGLRTKASVRRDDGWAAPFLRLPNAVHPDQKCVYLIQML